MVTEIRSNENIYYDVHVLISFLITSPFTGMTFFNLSQYQ